MNKGDYGYLTHYKKKHGIAMCIYLVIIIIMVVTAKILAHDITSTIQKSLSDPTILQKTGSYISIGLYMLAAVLSLPAAKHVVALVMVFSYHTIKKTEADKIEQYTKNLSGGLSLYDVTLSSPEYISYVPYIYLYNNKLYCLVHVTSKITVDDVKIYLEKILQSAGFQIEVIAVHTPGELYHLLECLVQNSQDEIKNDSKVLNQLKNQILVYSV